MKQYIIFDLDGTLTESSLGITNSLIYALDKYNIKVNDRSDLYKFVGPPLVESFEKYYGFSKKEATQAVMFYREYFQDKGMYENIVYDGIEDLLKYLTENCNKNLLVATSKPSFFAQKILDHFYLSKYFEFIAGSELDGSRSAKNEVINYALNCVGVQDVNNAIMIGDREYDIFGAKKNELKSVGVLYGYGNELELRNAGADYIAANVSDLRSLLTRDDL